MTSPPSKRTKLVHFVGRRHGSGSSSGTGGSATEATTTARGPRRGASTSSTAGGRGHSATASTSAAATGSTSRSRSVTASTSGGGDESDLSDLFLQESGSDDGGEDEDWLDEPESLPKSKKGKGKAPEAGNKHGKGHSVIQEAPPDRLSKEALLIALKELSPAIGLQALQTTAWTSIEAQHTLVELAIEQTRLLRVMATALALGLGSDGGAEDARAESDRLLTRIQSIPQARIPTFFGKGPAWNWRFVGSPWVALSTIASTMSWIRTSLTPNWLAGSRTSEQGVAVQEPVSSDRMPAGFWNIGDVPTDHDEDMTLVA